MQTTQLDLDFSNTAIAFSHKSEEELNRMAQLFSLMNKPWLVNTGASLGLLAFKLRLPLTETIVYHTIFKQFVGGRTLLECQPIIEHLHSYNVLTILDYGAEGKESEKDFNITMNETLRAIDFAALSSAIPVVSTKITGLTQFDLLEKVSAHKMLNTEEEHQYESLMKRIDAICFRAQEKKVALFIDAEESWIQNAIDQIVEQMMARYNTSAPVVYNTIQLYRHDRLAYLKRLHSKGMKEGFLTAVKMVRGAYMEKERERAKLKKYPSPIQPDKMSTHRDFNEAVRYCVDHFETIASCNASHNAESNLLQAKLIHEKGIQKNHAHLNFCQLFGMSDNLTFNLAQSGYNVAKYLPYGPVRDVIPYLIRRTQENTTVTGDMSREFKLIQQEIKRRKQEKVTT
jgi:proline dehydrogenase